MSHGDLLGTKGGDGIIGTAGMVLRGDYKVRMQSQGENRPYKTLFVGHFHTSLYIPSRIVGNGSLVGISEYSRNMLRAPPSPPSQTLITLNGSRGITNFAPIFVDTATPKPRSQQTEYGI